METVFVLNNKTNASSANQTNGAQKTQIVTSGGTTVDSFGGGTQYLEGDNVGTESTGTVLFAKDSSNQVRPLQVASDGKLQVEAVASNFEVNMQQVNYNTVATGLGYSDAGTLRVAIADDNGVATSVKQDAQSALLTTLNALITVLNEKVATDDSLLLLRDIRTILYNHGNADGAKRQVVSINLPGAAVTTTLPISGSVTATVASTTITGLNGIDPRFQVYDMGHVRYATSMRANLTFS